MSKLPRFMKLAIGSFIIAIVSLISLFLLVLLPSYNIVGSTMNSGGRLSSTNESLIHRSSVLSAIFVPLIGISLVAMVIFFIIGLTKLSRKNGS